MGPALIGMIYLGQGQLGDAALKQFIMQPPDCTYTGINGIANVA